MRKFLFIILSVFTLQVQSQTIAVETSGLAMVFTVNEDKTVTYHYFGNRMADYSGFTERKFLSRPDTQEDFAPELFPAYGGRNYLEPALQATHEDGSLVTELIYQDQHVRQIDDNLTETTISLKDKLYPLWVNVRFKAYYRENVITQQVVIKNREQGAVLLERFHSAFLPLHHDSYYLTHFHGTWAAEMQCVQEKLEAGTKLIESKKGVRTTQSENPSFLLSVNQPTGEETGEVYAGSLAWSGNYALSFQLDECGILNVLGGMNPFLSAVRLQAGEELSTPEMVWTYSRTGVGQVSRNLHDWTRKYALAHGEKQRPIVLNSWEGAYFDFDEATIVRMIDDAADFGIELFVLDDGWFGNKHPRNGDNAGLGDWQTNKKKLPRGIHHLAERAHRKGLQFGIWIEPEMVNPKSELAEQHPEWIVRTAARGEYTMRNQWLLDLSNPDVQDFVVKTFDEVMAQSPYISYVKWDANRHVDNLGSSFLDKDHQKHFWIAYTKGLYAVYEKIRQKYPDVAIQLCSSGGGRLDFGALKYHDEFWASDNTNPLDRVFIQYGTNLFFPAMATGSHVSTSPNHQTGLITPLKFRFDVAMSGRLGLELQPSQIKGEERVFARETIQTYKKVRPVIQFGDLFRLQSPYGESGWSSLMYVSKDKRESVFFAFSLKSHERTRFFECRLSGLDAGKTYKIEELNRTGNSSFWGNEQSFTGEYLMSVGILLSLNGMFDSAVFLLSEVN